MFRIILFLLVFIIPSLTLAQDCYVKCNGWRGKGVLISRSGSIDYILTAKHLTNHGNPYYVNSRRARLVRSSPTYDLALLSVRRGTVSKVCRLYNMRNKPDRTLYGIPIKIKGIRCEGFTSRDSDYITYKHVTKKGDSGRGVYTLDGQLIGLHISGSDYSAMGCSSRAIRRFLRWKN